MVTYADSARARRVGLPRLVMQRIAILSLTVLATTLALVPPPAFATHSEPIIIGCMGRGVEPQQSGWRGLTKKQATMCEMTVQLRYNPDNRYAWGRILGGTRYDRVWVDRTTDTRNPPRLWQCNNQPLGVWEVKSGGGTHTDAYLDNGRHVNLMIRMRACAWSKDAETVVCTDWY